VIRTICIALILLQVCVCAYAAVVPIEETKEINSEGIPKYLGRVFTISGVVTVPSGAFNSNDLDIHVQDETAGINVFKAGASDLRFEVGDSVLVTGVIDQVMRGNTLLRVETVDDIQLLGQGTVPAPLVVTAADISAAAQPPVELYEGRLVRLEDISFDPADWPASGTDKKLSASDYTGTFSFTIDRDTDIDGTASPRTPVILTGVVIQSTRRYPYLRDYVVWPRTRYGDFAPRGNGSGTAVISPEVVDIGAAPFDIEIKIGGNGIDTITDLAIGLPLDDGWSWEAVAGNVEISGPGLTGADFEVAGSGITVHDATIDVETSYGVVFLKNISPPGVRVDSRLSVSTSVDGTTFEEIDLQPVLKSLYPKPDVVISEVYPHDGSTLELNSFVELHNVGSTTARLEGFSFCEQPAVAYCDKALRHVFGASDTIPPDGYLVLVASLEGFETRFALSPPLEQPPIEAPISPLGRIEGDGGICGSVEAYELLTLWRDDSFTDLVAYMEYADGTACAGDLCAGFGDRDDAFPYIPPVGYALLGGDYDPCCPYEILTSSPTPGAANVTDYDSPVVTNVKSHDKRTVEIFFSEPMDRAALEDPANYRVSGGEPVWEVGARTARGSISGEEVSIS